MIQSEVEIKSNKEEFQKELDRVAEKVLTMWGMTIRTAAVYLAPKDTGRLQNSITYEVDPADRSVIIGTNVEYAPYQELGTSKMKAHPYLRPAIENNIDWCNQVLEEELENAT